MPTIKAQVEIEIFDNPDYCDDGIESCPSLNKNDWRCDSFRSGNALIKNEMLRWFFKCDQCKTAYMRAKENYSLHLLDGDETFLDDNF